MSLDGAMSIDLVEANHGTLPDRRQLASARRKPSAGYLDGVRRFAMLERDQEYMLAKRWREHGDRDAANKLVTSHLRLAVKVAMNSRLWIARLRNHLRRQCRPVAGTGPL